MVSLRMRLVIGQLRKNKDKPKELSVTAYRQGMDSLASSIPIIPESIEVTPDHAGSIPLEWISHKDTHHDSVVFYLHGGGYIAGQLELSRFFVSQFVMKTKIPFLLIDYKLAPENPFPAALNDALSVYEWITEKKRILPKRILFFGESAGGGLVLSTLVKLRDERKDLPAAAVCLSPWTDLAGTGDTMITKAEIDPILSMEEMAFLVKQYIGEHDPMNPLISPLYADLHGLPPLFIQVGTSEMILDDSVRLSEKAENEGVDVTLDIWKDMPHVFTIFFQFAPESRKGIDKICKYITQQIG